MWRRYRIELVISIVLGIGAALVFPWPLQGERSIDAAAHDHAEHVLFPLFVSRMNEWLFNHPMSDPDHLKKFDAKDVKRLQAARQAWHDFDEEMKRAGY